MTEIVKLVNAWGKFEIDHPSAEIADFCRYYIQTIAASPSQSLGKGNLARTISRIATAYDVYHRAAIEKMGLPGVDSFYYLNSLHQLGTVNKMELIHYLMAETTTGMQAIMKLIKAGYIAERRDPNDARARLINVTEKGEKKLLICSMIAAQVNTMIFSTMDNDSIDLTCKLLATVEHQHSRQAVELKNKPFNEMVSIILGNKHGLK